MLVPLDLNNTTTGWFLDTSNGKPGFYVAGTKVMEAAADGTLLTVTPLTELSGAVGINGSLTARSDVDVTGDLDVTGDVGEINGAEVHTDKVSLTNAQIKALRATPITLVAAPGTGKVLEFISALLRLTAGTNVLTETDANLGIKYTDGAGVQVNETVEATAFIDQAVDTWTNARPKADAIAAATGIEDQALVLHNLGAGEYAGNAANDALLDVYITYRILDV